MVKVLGAEGIFQDQSKSELFFESEVDIFDVEVLYSFGKVHAHGYLKLLLLFLFFLKFLLLYL